MNDERLTANVVKKLLDESAANVSLDIQARLNLAITKSVQLHAEKYGNHAVAPTYTADSLASCSTIFPNG